MPWQSGIRALARHQGPRLLAGRAQFEANSK